MEMVEDSNVVAHRWETQNPGRAEELNDALDACPDRRSQQRFYATLTKDEQRGMMPERVRRGINKVAPVGSLVRSSHDHRRMFLNDHGIHYNGIAVVIGQDGHGGMRRYVMLQPPLEWDNRLITYAEVSYYDLEVIK